MTRPYDLRTLEMVLAWCEREEKRWRENSAGASTALWTTACEARVATLLKLRSAIKRHAAKARKR